MQEPSFGPGDEIEETLLSFQKKNSLGNVLRKIIRAKFFSWAQDMAETFLLILAKLESFSVTLRSSDEQLKVARMFSATPGMRTGGSCYHM